MQAVLLLALGGSILSVWGAPAGSDMRTDALAFLQVKALGAPVTVLLLVLQVRLAYNNTGKRRPQGRALPASHWTAALRCRHAHKLRCCSFRDQLACRVSSGASEIQGRHLWPPSPPMRSTSCWTRS